VRRTGYPIGVTLLLAGLLSTASAGQAPEALDPEEPYSAPSPPPEKLSVYAVAAAVEGEDPPRLTGDGPDFALGFGLGQRFNRYVSGEAELLITAGEYDTPPSLGFSDDDMTLTGGFLLYSVKLRYPAKRLQPYLGVGLGVAYHRLQVTGSFGFGTVDVDSDFRSATQRVAGIDLVTGEKTRIGLELRELDAHADFGSISGGEIDVGGRMWTFAYRRVVSRHRR